MDNYAVRDADLTSRIVRNSLWLFTGETLSKTIVFAFTLVVARGLGVIGFGVYSFGVSLVMICCQFVTLGLPTFLTREISRDRARTAEFTGGALLTCVLPAVLYPLMMVALVYAMSRTAEVQILVLLLGIWISVDGISGLFKSSFYAHEKMQYVTWVNVSFQVVRIAVVLLVLKLGLGAIGVGSATLIASVASLALGVYLFMKHFPYPKFSVDLSLWAANVKQSLPLALLVMLLGNFGRVDNVMLSLMRGNESVGYYSAPFRFVATLAFLPAVVVHAAFPQLSRHAFADVERFRSLIASLLKAVAVIMGVVSVGLFVFVRPVTEIIYGREYLPSYHTFRVLAWVPLVSAMSYVLVYGLNAKNKQMMNVIFAGIAIMTNIGVNTIAISRFGHFGAACSSLFSQMLLLSILIIYACREEYTSLRMLVPSTDDCRTIYRIALQRYDGQ